MNDGEDYDNSNFCFGCVNRARQETLKKLKSEAIKWIKLMKKGEYIDVDGKHYEPNTIELKMFESFFNLTEEDLE